MRFGLFARFPLRFGGGRPEAQRIYESMRDNRGERLKRADDGDENRTLRCAARAIARAASYQRRGQKQAWPTTATDEMPKWERLLGVPTDPRDTMAQRGAACAAVLAGNGPPEYDQIVTAMRLATGETPILVAATRTRKTPGALVAYAYDGDIFTGTRLLAGTHYYSIAFETATEMRAVLGAGVALTAGQGLRLKPIPLSTVAGAIRVHYYLSVAPDSTARAWVGSNTGESVEFFDYPVNPGTPDLHHMAIVVSLAVWSDTTKRARIHAVLGTMLPATVTYDITTETPFVLGETLLGQGAF